MSRRKHEPAWTCLQPTKESSWHTSASCLCGQALVIIGGTGREGKSAEVYVYHLHELQWLKAETTGKGPPTRPLYCSATGRGESVAVVWSKQQPGTSKVLVTLSVLSLNQMRWHSIALDGTVSPPRRGYRAAMSAHGDVLILGGEGSVNEHLPSSACVLVQDDDTVSLLPREECPPPRSDHACTVAPHDTIVIHGGKGTGGVLLGDMWVYDAARRTWLEIGNGPQRCGHGISATERMILLFGGVSSDGVVCNDLWIWNVEGHEWRGPIMVECTLPSPRAGHLFSLVWPVLDDPSPEPTTCFVLYGGVGGPNLPPFHDVYRLAVPTDSTQLPLVLSAVAKTRSPKLLHSESVRNNDSYLTQDSEDAEIVAAMHKLKETANFLDDKERELNDIEITRRNKEMQLQLDREKLDRDRAQLVSKMHRMETIVNDFEQKNMQTGREHWHKEHSRNPPVSPGIYTSKPQPAISMRPEPAATLQLEYNAPTRVPRAVYAPVHEPVMQPAPQPPSFQPSFAPMRPVQASASPSAAHASMSQPTTPVHSAHPAPHSRPISPVASTRTVPVQPMPMPMPMPIPQPTPTLAAHPVAPYGAHVVHNTSAASPTYPPAHAVQSAHAVPATPSYTVPTKSVPASGQITTLEAQLAQERQKVQLLMGQLAAKKQLPPVQPVVAYAPVPVSAPKATEPPFVVPQHVVPQQPPGKTLSDARCRVISPPRPVRWETPINNTFSHPVR